MSKSARNCSKIALPQSTHLTRNLESQIAFKVRFLFLELDAYIGSEEEVENSVQDFCSDAAEQTGHFRINSRLGKLLITSRIFSPWSHLTFSLVPSIWKPKSLLSYYYACVFYAKTLVVWSYFRLSRVETTFFNVDWVVWQAVFPPRKWHLSFKPVN